MCPKAPDLLTNVADRSNVHVRLVSHKLAPSLSGIRAKRANCNLEEKKPSAPLSLPLQVQTLTLEGGRKGDLRLSLTRASKARGILCANWARGEPHEKGAHFTPPIATHPLVEQRHLRDRAGKQGCKSADERFREKTAVVGRA